MKHEKGKSARHGGLRRATRRYSPRTLGLVALLAPTLGMAINTWSDSGTTVTSSETRRYDGAVTGPFGTPEVPRRSHFDLPALAMARTDTSLEDTSLTCPRAGNPAVIGTGRKFEIETDVAPLPGEMGLSLSRIWGAGDGDGIFGYGWHSNLDRKLQFVTANPSDPNICSPGPLQGPCSIVYRVTGLWALRPDGRKIQLLGEKPAQSWKLTALSDGNGWSVRTEDNMVEEYTYGGLIRSIKNEQGIGWTFMYGGSRNAQLQSVTHTGGRRLSFLWSGNQVQTVLYPENNAYQYAYTVIDQHANNPTGKTVLSDVMLPGPPPTKVSYHYGNIAPAGSLVRSGLLGKSFNGIRYSYFNYDNNYRVKSTEHAGGVERYTFDYILDPASSTSDVTRKVQKTTVTNPLNKKAEYSFNPQGRLTSVAGIPSASCGASYREITYDANGNEDVVSDFENKLTDYDYDAHGHLMMKVEAKGLPIARVTRYVWDESKNRLTRVTVDEDHETTYSYGVDDRLSAVSERNLKSIGPPHQVRTTTYAYTKHANGMLASVTRDGPLPGSADAVSSAYSPTGDLISVRNGLGHEVTYGNYTPLGLPRHVIGENGAATDYTYDARNRLVNVRTYPNNVAADTQYRYNDAGLLDAIIAPDGVRTSYLYDDAQRLTDEYQAEAAGTFAIKHYERNPMSLPTRIQVRRAASALRQG